MFKTNNIALKQWIQTGSAKDITGWTQQKLEEAEHGMGWQIRCYAKRGRAVTGLMLRGNYSGRSYVVFKGKFLNLLTKMKELANERSL